MFAVAVSNCSIVKFFGAVKDYCRLGCDTVQSGSYLPTLRRNLQHSYSLFRHLYCSPIMNIEAVGFSAPSASSYQTTRRQSAQDSKFVNFLVHAKRTSVLSNDKFVLRSFVYPEVTRTFVLRFFYHMLGEDGKSCRGVGG